MADSILFQLRDAAMNCPNILTRKMLRDSADEIGALAYQVGIMASLENIQALNGAVAKAMRTLSTAEQPNPDNTRGGAMPLPEKIAA
jgi:hypothetical protein